MLPDGEFDAPVGPGQRGRRHLRHHRRRDGGHAPRRRELVTGKPADRLEFTEVRAVEGLRETYVAIGEHNIHVGVANGLTNAKMLLDKVKAGEEQFHVIEVMACPGGCIGGGGQPYPPEGVKVLDPDCSASGPRPCTPSTAARSSANRTRTRPSRRFTTSSSAGRARKRPTNSCTPIITPKLPRGIR